MFPMTQIGIACQIFTFNKEATIKPPRHSRIGIKDVIKITTCADTCCPSVDANQVAMDSIITSVLNKIQFIKKAAIRQVVPL